MDEITIPTGKQFYHAAKKSIQRFDGFVRLNNLVHRTKADHIGFKCSSTPLYEGIRTRLQSPTLSESMSESIISGRRIAVFKLVWDFETILGQIDVLELSDQKPDGSQKNGFDHIEVLPVGDLTYDHMVEILSKTNDVRLVERPHHTTHDIDIGGFIFRCTREPLLEKIAREMAVSQS